MQMRLEAPAIFSIINVLELCFKFQPTKEDAAFNMLYCLWRLIAYLFILACVCVCVSSMPNLTSSSFIHSLTTTQVRRKWFASREALWKEVEGIRLNVHPHLPWYVVVYR